VGKWLEHLGVAAIETFLISDSSSSSTSRLGVELEVEDKIIADIKKFVG